tara:strand:- start:338 stop:823 length:486 start_codon:yes stop_codon:yes gene_type:complete
MALTKIADGGMPSGSIIQGVSAKQGSGTGVSANSTDWHGTGFGKSITPSSTSSKILILCSVALYQGTASKYYSVNLYRHTAAFTANGSVSGTQLFNDGKGFGAVYGNNGDRMHTKTCFLLDSPNTTSEVYYNVCHKEESGGSGIFDGYDIDSTIVLLEVVG